MSAQNADQMRRACVSGGILKERGLESPLSCCLKRPGPGAMCDVYQPD